MFETGTEPKPWGVKGVAQKLRGLRGKQLGVPLIIMLAAGFVWSFSQYREVQGELERLSSEQAQQQLAQAETDELLRQVGRHILLPEDEEPTVATVSDAEALRQTQPFFARAENGDRVLIYVNNRRSILYSPGRDVVVNVGALVVNTAEEETADESETGAAQVAGEQTTR